MALPFCRGALHPVPLTLLLNDYSGNQLPVIWYTPCMAEWSFLTNYGRVLLCIAHDPGVRLRDIATSLDITERSAYGIVTDLANAGYVVKERDGRRNRYEIQHHLPLPEATSRERTIGEVLDLLVDTNGRTRRREGVSGSRGRGVASRRTEPARRGGSRP
jgi:hypothetical protein